jgi:hypothetical protein
MWEWVISTEYYSWVKLNASDKMLKEFFGLWITLWFQRTSSFTTRSWMRLIALGILSIQRLTRRIKTWRSWSMCQSVTRAEESRPIIWDQLEIYNPWAFLSGNEKTSAWTLLCVCSALRILQGQIVRRALHITYCPLSWHPEDHYLWQRVYLCGTFLRTTT